MIKELIKLSNHLDKLGFTKEADYLDAVIKRASKPEDELSPENMARALDALLDGYSPEEREEILRGAIEREAAEKARTQAIERSLAESGVHLPPSFPQ